MPNVKAGAHFGPRADSCTDASTPPLGFGSSIRGFIRPPSSPGFKAGAPVIWVSKRKIKDGKMADNIKYWGILSEMQYVNAPGCVATIEVTADDAPDYLWSCRIFTDFDTGFASRPSQPSHSHAHATEPPPAACE